MDNPIIFLHVFCRTAFKDMKQPFSKQMPFLSPSHQHMTLMIDVRELSHTKQNGTINLGPGWQHWSFRVHHPVPYHLHPQPVDGH